MRIAPMKLFFVLGLAAILAEVLYFTTALPGWANLLVSLAVAWGTVSLISYALRVLLSTSSKS